MGRTTSAAAMALVVAAPHGQALDGLREKYGPGFLNVIPTSKLGNGWASRAWTGDEETYAALRRGVEARFAVGKGIEAEIERARSEATKHPKDPKAQYRWGYLSFLEARREAEGGTDRWTGPRTQVRDEIRWSLALAPDPKTAEYDRLRFLYEAADGKADEFRDLARRLARKWPDDEAILRNQALMLCNTSRQGDLEAAIAIADRLQRKYPKGIRYVGLKADVYHLSWISLRRLPDGLNAIEWTERYLRLLPAGSPKRPPLEFMLAGMRKHLGVPEGKPEGTRL